MKQGDKITMDITNPFKATKRVTGTVTLVDDGTVASHRVQVEFGDSKMFWANATFNKRTGKGRMRANVTTDWRATYSIQVVN